MDVVTASVIASGVPILIAEGDLEDSSPVRGVIIRGDEDAVSDQFSASSVENLLLR